MSKASELISMIETDKTIDEVSSEFNAKELAKFISKNEKTMGEFKPSVKFTGEKFSTKHLGIDWDVLKKIQKIM